jgi:hypothetical protein
VGHGGLHVDLLPSLETVDHTKSAVLGRMMVEGEVDKEE